MMHSSSRSHFLTPLLAVACTLVILLPACNKSTPEDVPPVELCSSPVPLMQQSDDGEVPTGFELCDDGYEHRVSEEECQFPEGLTGTCDDELECSSDADCTAAPHGYCNLYGGDVDHCYCDYGCETDAGCGANQICYCNGAETTCIDAYCKSDADCGDHHCVLMKRTEMCGNPEYYVACQTDSDTCSGDTDCTLEGEFCNYDPEDGRFECIYDSAWDVDC